MNDLKSKLTNRPFTFSMLLVFSCIRTGHNLWFCPQRQHNDTGPPICLSTNGLCNIFWSWFCWIIGIHQNNLSAYFGPYCD